MSPLSHSFLTITRSPSKSFAAAMVCFVLGIVAGPLADYQHPVLVVGIVCLGLVVFLRDKRRRLAALFCFAFFFGVWRYGQALVPPHVSTVADEVGRDVRVFGVVSAEVEKRSDRQRVVLDGLAVGDEPVDGKLLVWLDAYPEVAYADRLTFACALELPQPIESFRYDRYLRTQGVLAVCARAEFTDIVPAKTGGIVGALLSVKRVIVSRLALIVPEPHASFLSGLLFGGSSTLSKDLREDFSATGTSHILAASGFNVSLFSLIFLNWITHTALGRRRGAYLTAALLVAYVLVAGATAAVVRAGIMGALVLVGFLVRRKPSLVNVTLLALAAMLLANPLLLLDDVGFQLSFVATAAMLGASSRVEKRCAFIPEAFELRKSFAGSLAAILATLPIMLWHFGSVSLFSPVVNLLVLPLVPLLMSLTGIAIAAGFLFVPLGTFVALPAWAVSSVILHVISWFGAV